MHLSRRMKSNWKGVAATMVLLFIYYFTMKTTLTSLLDFDIAGSFWSTPRGNQSARGEELDPENWNNQLGIPHLAVTICGNRFEEPLTMLKSAVLFSKSYLIFHVVVDSAILQEKVKTELDSWPSVFKARVKYIIYNASFPADVSCKDCKGAGWKSLFLPCASQRLFLIDILKGVDSVLYVDADALFFAPVEELWSVLFKFNSTQFVAAISVTELPKSGVYYGGKIPVYGPNGINSGVLLMNLTRLRVSSWLTSVTDSLMKYKHIMRFGDQDLINVYMHDHPERSYLLTCDWNYQSNGCSKCDQADRTGVAILHGFMSSFKSDQIVPFKAIYLAFRQFRLGTYNIDQDLLQPIKRNLEAMKSQKSLRPNECHLRQAVFTKRLEDLIKQDQLT